MNCRVIKKHAYNMQIKIITFLLLNLFLANSIHAESELNLAKTVQNPLGINPEARYFTLPINAYSNFFYGSPPHTQNMLELKPITPFSLTSKYDIVFRTILPFTHQASHHGYTNGMGDLNPTAFITPAENRRFLWGVGPTIVIPTATNKNLGAGKWSIGPELVLLAMPRSWTLAILTNNIWSVEGSGNRKRVNQFSFQYFITYNFPQGWFVTTQPTLIANWLAPQSQKWTVPIGGGFGRIFKVGQQAISLSCESYNNVIRPTTSARWTLQANLVFLFADNRTAR
jgi:hypothetical protein